MANSYFKLKIDAYCFGKISTLGGVDQKISESQETIYVTTVEAKQTTEKKIADAIAVDKCELWHNANIYHRFSW